MVDAGPMILTCFKHQHPDLYWRPGIVPEFPRESMVGAELLPEGVNNEGYVWPELSGCYKGPDSC